MKITNLFVLRFAEPFRRDAEQLQTALAERPLRPCGKTERQVRGFISPFDDGETLVHSVQNCLLFAAGFEERLLPADVIRSELAERIEVIEQREGNKPSKREQRRMKEELEITLLPQAFVRRKQVYAWIDLDAQLLFVAAGSMGQVEAITEMLRNTLGVLNLRPVAEAEKIKAILTNWLSQHSAPTGYGLGDECDLQSRNDAQAKVSFRKQDLSHAAVHDCLKRDMQCIRLALEWQERINFSITPEGGIKRLQFGEVLETQLEDADIEDKRQELDARFALTALELRAALNDLLPEFGVELSE